MTALHYAARMTDATRRLLLPPQTARAFFFFLFLPFRSARENERKCFRRVASGHVNLENASGKNGDEVTGVIHARTESPPGRSGGLVGKGAISL